MSANLYHEATRDVYIRAAADFYKLAADADFETADPAQFLRRGRELETLAHETWPLNTRQDRRLSGLRAVAELNTPEGREYRDALIAKLGGTSA